jgi:hypothetical protein
MQDFQMTIVVEKSIEYIDRQFKEPECARRAKPNNAWAAGDWSSRAYHALGSRLERCQIAGTFYYEAL